MFQGRKAMAMGLMGVSLLLALPALSQAVAKIGTLEANIDGTAYKGETLAVPGEGTATATFQAFGPMTKVSIQALDPQSDSRMKNVLTLEVMFKGDPAANNITEQTVSWWPEGMRDPFYISEGSSAEVVISINEISLEDGAFAVGRFSATLCRKADFFAEADAGDCRRVEGSFDTLLKHAG